MTELPRLAVFYDEGSSSILQIVEAAQDVCRILWVVGWSRDVPPFRELTHYGEVVDLTEVDVSRRVDHVVALRPDGVVVFHDAPLMLAAGVADRLGLPFHSLDTAWLLTDKVAQRTALLRAGVPTPAFSIVRRGSVESDVPLPAVLKPRVGAGSRDTFKIESREQLNEALALCPDDEEFILEEWLVNRDSKAGPRSDQVGVESVARNGVVESIAVSGFFTFDPPFRTTGSFVPSDFSETERDGAASAAASAIEALNIHHGLLHVEIKLTPDGPRIIEVNGRLGGNRHELIARIGGPPLRVWAMRLALGQDVGPIPSIASSPVAFVRYANAPMAATHFDSVTGVKEVRKLAGVDRVRVSHKPGDTVDYRQGIPAGVVVRIDGMVESHAALWHLVDDQIAELLQLKWRF